MVRRKEHSTRFENEHHSSEQIFNVDPLLLDKSNQEAFAELLLEQIIYRGRGRLFKSTEIDLFNEKDREKLKVRRPTTIEVPTQKAIEYYKSKRRREILTVDAEIEKQLKKHTVVYDPARTEIRYEGTPDVDSTKKKEGTYLRIGAISYHIGISKHVEKAYFDEHLSFMSEAKIDARCIVRDENAGNLQLARTQTNEQESLKKEWMQHTCELIDKALQRSCHIICLPEFSLPPRDIDRGEDNDDVLQAYTDLCSKAPSDNFFLFAGSRHDGLYNRGAVIARNHSGVSYPNWHYKIASSRRLGENILGPGVNLIPSYTLTYPTDVSEKSRTVKINVAICFDAFDPTLFLAFAAHRHKDEDDNADRIILVPSFNPSSDFINIVRDLSFLSNSIVLYVNSAFGDASLFISGFRVFDVVKLQKRMELRDYIGATISSLEEKKEKEVKKMSESLEEVDLNNQLPEIEGRLSNLKSLQDTISELSAHEIEGIMTVEPCSQCKSKRDDKRPYCNHDILYFDLPHKLIDALVNHRGGYFLERRYIPWNLKSGKLLEEALNDD